MKKIMIVEDENALREVFVMLFKMQKFQVYEAANGQEALDQLDTAKPDVIVLDILMPVMGGMKFLEAANLAERYPTTKVLVLSNLSDSRAIAKLKGHNITYVLKSSVSPGQLVDQVNALLKAG